MRCIEDIEDILNDEKSTPVNKKLREQKQRKTNKNFSVKKKHFLFLCGIKFNI